MKKARFMDQIPDEVRERITVIDSRAVAVGQGQNPLRYLSRYVFRVAISNNCIKYFDNYVVRFLYKDRIKKEWKTMTLDAMEFENNKFSQPFWPVSRF